MSEEEEVEHLLKVVFITVGAGAVEAVGVNVKHPVVFVEVLKDRRRFK